MPRYFFDLVLNGVAQKDTSGRELDDPEAARKHAIDVILNLATICDRAKVLDCACTVHDALGKHVYRHTLTRKGRDAADASDRRSEERSSGRGQNGAA